MREIFIEICSNYYTIKLKQNSSVDTNNIAKQIDYRIDTIESKLLYLGLETVGFKSSYRYRRGLIDGLGTVVKAITGNLDQSDAIQFDKEIRTIQSSLTNDRVNQRKTISIMQDFMKEYENNLKNIKDNQIKIYKEINRYSTQKTEFETNFLTRSIFNDIENSLQQLYDRLDTLENALTFSHLEKMHPSIIDPSHLIEELNQIKKEISGYLAFAPNSKNIQLWEKAITVKAYSTNETINFILDIPIVAEQPYDLLHLYSIPNTNNTILIPKNPLLILGNNEFAYPHEPCTEITEDEVICKHLEWNTLLHSNDCIAQLIQHQEPHNCTYVTATLKNNIIQQIKDNSWIVIMKHEEVIKTICGNDIQYQRNKGVLLITTDNNCKVQVMDRTLTTHQRYIKMQETIPLPRAHQTPKALPIKINLEEIKLDSLKEALKQADEVKSSITDTVTISSTPSWSSISLYIILAGTAISIAVYKYWWIPKSAHTSVSQQPEAETIQLQSQPSVRLHLKGGGVI